jgi:hypothetical protein
MIQRNKETLMEFMVVQSDYLCLEANSQKSKQIIQNFQQK